LVWLRQCFSIAGSCAVFAPQVSAGFVRGTACANSLVSESFFQDAVLPVYRAKVMLGGRYAGVETPGLPPVVV